jgi:hypothetical protein
MLDARRHLKNERKIFKQFMDQRIYNSNTTIVQLGTTYLPLDIINLQIYCTSLSCRPTSFLAKLLFFKECVLLHLYYGWIFNYHVFWKLYVLYVVDNTQLTLNSFHYYFFENAPKTYKFFFQFLIKIILKTSKWNIQYILVPKENISIQRN